MTAGTGELANLRSAGQAAERRYTRHAPRLLPLATVALLLLIWQGATAAFHIQDYVLPSPQKILTVLVDSPGQVGSQTAVTLYEIALGYFLAIAMAIPLAVAVVESEILQRSIYPIVIFLQSVPKVALAPLLLIWVGYGSAPKILIVLLTCFFPIFLNTASGLGSTPRDQLDLMRSLEASRLQTLRKVRFPTALPQVFVGLKVGVTLAVIGAVVGEFVSAKSGLGYLIETASSQLETPLAFAALLVLAVISIVLFYLLGLIEMLAVPWARKQQEGSR